MSRPPEGPRDLARRGDGLDERQIRRLALVGGLVLVIVVLLVFIVENSDEVRVSFVFFSADMSLIWVIVLSALAGAVAGAIVTRLVRRRFLGRD